LSISTTRPSCHRPRRPITVSGRTSLTNPVSMPEKKGEVPPGLVDAPHGWLDRGDPPRAPSRQARSVAPPVHGVQSPRKRPSGGSYQWNPPPALVVHLRRVLEERAARRPHRRGRRRAGGCRSRSGG